MLSQVSLVIRVRVFAACAAVKQEHHCLFHIDLLIRGLERKRCVHKGQRKADCQSCNARMNQSILNQDPGVCAYCQWCFGVCASFPRIPRVACVCICMQMNSPAVYHLPDTHPLTVLQVELLQWDFVCFPLDKPKKRLLESCSQAAIDFGSQ